METTSCEEVPIIFNFCDCLQLHVRSAGRLRDMCSRNGALFIKVGQHIGSLDYLLPPEYVNTFKVFHSEAPKTPLHQLKKVIEKEMKRPGEATIILASVLEFLSIQHFHSFYFS